VPVDFEGDLYTSMPKNRIFITIVKSISADSKVISSLIIIPRVNIIAS
jgi:hypothetical protein